MFFLHSWIHDTIELSLAWIAIIGAMVHLVVSGIHDVEEVLEKVELSTLIFFAGLFVLMKGLEELGLIEFVGDQVSAVVNSVPQGNGRLIVACMMIIWVSVCQCTILLLSGTPLTCGDGVLLCQAIISAFIDNIPYTTAMVPVVVQLSVQYVLLFDSIQFDSIQFDSVTVI
jgi:P protein